MFLITSVAAGTGYLLGRDARSKAIGFVAGLALGITLSVLILAYDEVSALSEQLESASEAETPPTIH